MARTLHNRRTWRAGRLGAALLEVVLSVGVLATAMTFIGATIRFGMSMAGQSRDQIDALMLAETVLAEMSMNDLSVALEEEFDDALTGDFGDRYPGYAWQVQVAETSVEGLMRVTVAILLGEPVAVELDEDATDDTSDTAMTEEDADLDAYTNYREVYVCHVLRAQRMAMDLTQVVGEEQATQIVEQLPPEMEEMLTALGIDPADLDVAEILQTLPMDQLLEIMPLLNRVMGGALGSSVWTQLQQEIMRYQSQQSSGQQSSDGDEGDDGEGEGDQGDGEDGEGDDGGDGDVGRGGEGGGNEGDSGRRGGDGGRRGGDDQGDSGRRGGDGGRRGGGDRSDQPSIDELIEMAEEAGPGGGR